MCLQSEVEGREKLIQQKVTHAERLNRDIEFWRQKFSAAEERAQREVHSSMRSPYIRHIDFLASLPANVLLCEETGNLV